MNPQIIAADWTYHDGQFRAGVQVGIDANGLIAEVRPASSSAVPPLSPASDPSGASSTTRRLSGRALLPGFVNVHSHAFQRALRGNGEIFPAGMGDFWSWREAMYGLVQTLDAAAFKRICKLAFEEMLAGGVTTVGEFHYLHHQNPHAADFAFDELVLEAAAETGIRLVLLMSYYRTGGFAGGASTTATHPSLPGYAPLSPGQQHFGTPNVADFLRQADRIAAKLDPRTQTIGLAPHSLRAVPTADLIELHRAAVERGWVCHIHVEEQRREITDCKSVIHQTPLEWILENLPIGPHFTMVHATHSTDEMLDRYLATGANICVCPITEGNLGDGLANIMKPDAAHQRRANAVCIGTDSNVRLDMAEELRWLEFVQRLNHEKRGICKTPDGNVARYLFDCGTANGARALALNAGKIEPGRPADFFTIDLDHISLRGWKPENLLDTFLFGSGGACVRETCVGGAWRIVG